MWLLAKSPESKYRQSVFCVMYLILMLLWLPPASPFCLSIENILAVPGADMRSLDVAGYETGTCLISLQLFRGKVQGLWPLGDFVT